MIARVFRAMLLVGLGTSFYMTLLFQEMGIVLICYIIIGIVLARL